MCFSISVRTEIHNTLLQYSALTAALSTERAKWRWVTWEVFFIFEESYWKRTPEWLCLAGLCVRGVRCTDLSLCRQAERINSSQRFWNGSKKLSLFFQTIHSFTGHVASHRQTPTSTKKKKSLFLFAGCLCLSVSLRLPCTALYVCTHFCWCCVNVKSSKAAAWKPELLNVLLVIAWSFISWCQERAALQGKLGFGRQICKI